MKTTATTVGDIIAIGAHRHPNRAAVRNRSGEELSYAELDRRATRLANAMLGKGLQPGDRVAVWMADTFEHIEAYLAAAKAGMVVCSINARLTANEANHLLADSDSRLIIVTSDLGEKVEGLDAGILAAVPVLCVGAGTAHTLDYEQTLSAASTAPTQVQVHPDALFILGYTSGTSGRPKGAQLTHRSVCSIARQNAFSFRLHGYPEWGLTGSMSFVSVVPSHVLSCLSIGGTVNIMGKWSADALVDIIEARRLNFAYIPSPLLSEVTEEIRRRPAAVSSLDSVLHSASQADPRHLGELFEVVGDRLVEGWGMTEHSGGLATATTRNDYGDPEKKSWIFSSVGRPTIDVEVKLVDESGDPCPHDGETVGELCIASPALMDGYYGNEEATAAALRDSWFHTGDLGSISPEGYVSISARRTDLIISGGANVYPSEVEQCIAQLDGVSEVAVVGVPHERWGQTVVAVVVRETGSRLAEEEVIAFCRRSLAGYKKPSAVLFSDELPRTTSLKVARGKVQAWAIEEVQRSVR